MKDLLENVRVELALFGIKGFAPTYGQSTRYKEWTAHPTPGTCLFCISSHGKVFLIDERLEPEPPVHPNCKCEIETMLAIIAGTATIDGRKGADFYIRYYSTLPNAYCTKQYAKQHGWNKWKGNLQVVLPDAIIGGDVYENREGKLPSALGRIWYEADINYTGGFRNHYRILYSNDGLIFVTYDHYRTFCEIIKGDYDENY